MLNKGRAKTTLQCMLSMIMVLWALCIPSHTAQSFLAWSFLERILSPQLKVFHDINSHYSPQIIAGFLQDCVDSSLWKLQCVLVYFTSFDIVVNLPSALGMVGVSTIWMHLYLNEKACVSFLVKNLLVGSSGIWTRETGQSLFCKVCKIIISFGQKLIDYDSNCQTTSTYKDMIASQTLHVVISNERCISHF